MWTLLHPRMTPEDLGFLPYIISPNDPRPVKEQVEDKYAHGGGWNPYPEGRWVKQGLAITYPGDPTLTPVAEIQIRDETVYLYQHAIVMVDRADGSYDILRMD